MSRTRCTAQCTTCVAFHCTRAYVVPASHAHTRAADRIVRIIRRARRYVVRVRVCRRRRCRDETTRRVLATAAPRNGGHGRTRVRGNTRPRRRSPAPVCTGALRFIDQRPVRSQLPPPPPPIHIPPQTARTARGTRRPADLVLRRGDWGSRPRSAAPCVRTGAHVDRTLRTPRRGYRFLVRTADSRRSRDVVTRTPNVGNSKTVHPPPLPFRATSCMVFTDA